MSSHPEARLVVGGGSIVIAIIAAIALLCVAVVNVGSGPAAEPTLKPPDPDDIDVAACEQVSHPASSTEAKNGINAMDPSGEYIADGLDPYLWHGDEKTEIDGIEDVNSSGIVAGNSDGAAWRYKDGEFTELHPPKGIDENIAATAINENGDVVGYYGGAGPKIYAEHNVVTWPADSSTAVELPDSKIDSEYHIDINDNGTVIATDHDSPVIWTSAGREEVSLPFEYWRVNSAVFAGDWVAVSTSGRNVKDAGTAWKLSDSDNKRMFDMEFNAIDAQGRGYGVIENVPVRQDGDTFEALPFPTSEREIFSNPIVTITAVSGDGSTVSGGIIDAGDGEKLINNVMWHCE